MVADSMHNFRKKAVIHFYMHGECAASNFLQREKCAGTQGFYTLSTEFSTGESWIEHQWNNEYNVDITILEPLFL